MEASGIPDGFQRFAFIVKQWYEEQNRIDKTGS
jgi:hypothetical protein